MAQVERPEREIHIVTSDIGEGTATKVPPVPPVEVRPTGVVWLFRNGAEPEVPIKIPWDGCRELGVTFSSAGAGSDPDVDFADFADRTRADEFHNPAIVCASVNLGAHLRDPIRFAGKFGNVPDFRDGAAKGLLTVDVFAGLHGGDTGDGMGVIGSGNHHCIQVLLLYQLAKILVGLGGGKLLRDRGEAVLVDVAEGCDVCDILELPDAVTALPGRSYNSDVDLLVCRNSLLGPQDCGCGYPASNSSSTGGNKVSARERAFVHGESADPSLRGWPGEQNPVRHMKE